MKRETGNACTAPATVLIARFKSGDRPKITSFKVNTVGVYLRKS